MKPAGLSGVEIAERAVELLRAQSAWTWSVYLAGALPFMLGLLWFAVELGIRGDAREIAPVAALALTALYVLRQMTDALFLARLRDSMTGEAASVRLGPLLLRQSAIQPSALLALPLALLAAVPWAGAAMFYRYFSLESATHPDGALGRAWNLAKSRVVSSWILFAITLLVFVLLYINGLATLLVAAMLAKGIFGVESLVASPNVLIMTSAVHYAALLFAHLGADLLLGSAAVTIAHHAECERTGRDLLSAIARVAACAAILFALTTPPALAAPVEEAALNQAIDQALLDPDFRWRKAEPAPAWVLSVRDVGFWAGRFVRRVVEWIFDWFRPPAAGGGEGGATSDARTVYWVAGAGALLVLALAVYLLRQRREQPNSTAPAAPASVDIRDESVTADRLEEDEWLRMADDLARQGDLRGAIRAMHLAGLRMLFERRLVTIQRWKTGMDYKRELARRAQRDSQVNPLFAANLRMYEFGWFSQHPVSEDMLARLRDGLTAMRSSAHA